MLRKTHKAKHSIAKQKETSSSRVPSSEKTGEDANDGSRRRFWNIRGEGACNCVITFPEKPAFVSGKTLLLQPGVGTRKTAGRKPQATVTAMEGNAV